MNEAVILLKERKELLDENLKLKQENEHLKLVLSQIHYCPYDNKCGELYDCSKEEYETMTQSNMKLSLENDRLQQELTDYKERNEKAIEYIKSKNNGVCLINGEEKGAYTFVLNFDEAREFIWHLLEILDKKEVQDE